jgi:hypothetical protein
VTNPHSAGDADPLVYQCRLPLSTATLTYVGDLLRRRLREIGSPGRLLPPGTITGCVNRIV